MAHEIRNPLVSIGGFARRIAKLVEPNSPLRGYVEVIREEVTRLEKLLREILDFTGENLSYYGDHELAKLIEDTLILVQRDLDANKIKVAREFAIEGLSFAVFRRVATMIIVPAQGSRGLTTEMVSIGSVDLADAQRIDASASND